MAAAELTELQAEHQARTERLTHARKAHACERHIRRITEDAVKLSPKYRQMVADALEAAVKQVAA